MVNAFNAVIKKNHLSAKLLKMSINDIKLYGNIVYVEFLLPKFIAYFMGVIKSEFTLLRQLYLQYLKQQKHLFVLVHH